MSRRLPRQKTVCDYRTPPCRYALILESRTVEYADLAVLDLAKASTPEGTAELAATARDALRHIGFFYVVNHGKPEPEVSLARMLVHDCFWAN